MLQLASGVGHLPAAYAMFALFSGLYQQCTAKAEVFVPLVGLDGAGKSVCDVVL